jgi:hypothetical protein
MDGARSRPRAVDRAAPVDIVTATLSAATVAIASLQHCQSKSARLQLQSATNERTNASFSP